MTSGSPKRDEARQRSLISLLDASVIAGYACLVSLAPLVTSDAVPGEGLFVIQAMLWMVLFVLFALRLRLDRSHPSVDRFTAIMAGLFLLWGAAAVTQVVGRGDVRSAINGWWQWVACLTALLMGRRIARTTPAAASAIVGLIIAVAAAVAWHGLLQYGFIFPENRRQFELHGPTILATLGINRDSPEASLYRDRVLSPEPLAAFALTNSLAAFLLPWMFPFFTMLFRKEPAIRRAPAPPPWVRRCSTIGLILAAIGLVACLWLTRSRSALAALVCGSILWAFRSRWEPLVRTPGRRAALIPLGAILFLGAAGLAATMQTSLETTAAGKSIVYRLQYWESSARMVADSSAFGVGPGNFQQAYARYKIAEASETPSDPHNFVVEIAATLGVPGLLLFLAWAAALAAASETSERRFAPGESPAATTWAYRGSFAAFFLAPLLQLAAGHSVETIFKEIFAVPIVLIMCPLAMLIALRPLEYSRAALVIGAIAGVLNFTAAGGIGFPSTAIPFFALLAFAFPERTAEHTETSPSESMLAANGRLGGAIALAVGCYFMMFLPVLECRRLMFEAEAAEQNGTIRVAEEELQRATQADRFDPRPPLARARTLMTIFVEGKSTPVWIDCREALSEAIRRDRGAVSAYRFAGECRLFAARALRDPDLMREAVEYYAEAAERAPENNVVRAELAWALSLAKRRSSAAEEAKRSLELDERNPHVQKKLSAAKPTALQRTDASDVRNWETICRELAAENTERP